MQNGYGVRVNLVFNLRGPDVFRMVHHSLATDPTADAFIASFIPHSRGAQKCAFSGESPKKHRIP
jgi:hypothetical protein